MTKTKTIAMMVTAGSIALAPLQAAEAGNGLGKVLAGVVAGGIFACASGMVECKGKLPRKKRPSTPRRPTISVAQRQQNAQIQSALNYFGWNVGTVDGALGRKSRAGISNYQAYMGYPITGRLTDYERQQLVDGWQRTQAGGGAIYSGVLAGEGPRGLLHAYRDGPAAFGGRYGGAGVAGYQQPPYAPPAPVDPRYGGQAAPWQQDQSPSGPPAWPDPATLQPISAEGSADGSTILAPLPLLQTQHSMISHCETVATQARINGSAEPTTAAALLDDQFCRLRTMAMDESAGLIGTLSGVTDDQLDAHCNGLAEKLSTQIAALSIKSTTVAVGEVSAALSSTGSQPSAYARSGKICLGHGFRSDRPEVTLASALTLAAAGQPAYGEVVGHQLQAGFGVGQNGTTARAWFDTAFTALDQGAAPAFQTTDDPRRVARMRAALNGQFGTFINDSPALLPLSQ